jgi:hypothetical protein
MAASGEVQRDVSSEDIAALEGIEAEAWIDIYRSQPIPSPYRLEETVTPRGVALLGLTSIPWTEFNKALGFRPGVTLDRPGIDAMTRWFENNASASWALQVPDPMLHAGLRLMLRDAGLESKGRGMAKLRRGHSDPDAGGTTALEVRQVSIERWSDFAHTVRTGFGGPPVLAETCAALPDRPGWSTYAAYDGDVPVACGALFVQGSLGWVGIGATRPEWRGKGAQSALIRRRIRDGLAAGVRTFTAETGVPAPGQERKSVSFNNLVRAGFELAYTRSNFGAAEVGG